MMADLFADVKVGDAVFEAHNYGFNRYLVDRVTGSRFFVNCREYRKSDGKRIGEKWEYVRPASDEMAAKWERERAVNIAMSICNMAIGLLSKARGDEAIRLAALLPPELKGK